MIDRLDHEFSDRRLLELALTHRSWCAENPGSVSNERLEFLGDAVLGLAVADHCYRAYAELPEGQLAKVRAEVVSASSLAAMARDLGLGQALRLGRGEVRSGGDDKTSILADAMEAVIGAVYLDGGWPAARALVVRHLGDRVDAAASGPGATDYKTRLQELAAREGSEPPRYEVAAHGPDHDKRFVAAVIVDDEVRGRGRGTSKKQAEQTAAREAWDALVHAGRSGEETGDAPAT